MNQPNERQSYFLKRREKGITLTQIAKAIGTSHATLSRYETGVLLPNSKIIRKYKEYIDNYVEGE